MDRVDVLLGFNAEMHETLIRQGWTVAVFDDRELPRGIVSRGTWLHLFGWFEEQRRRGVELRFIVGVASSAAARAKARQWVEFHIPDVQWGRVISEKACVSPSSRIGAGAFVGDMAYVGPGSIIGDHACVLPGGKVYHDSVLGPGSIVVGNAAVLGRARVGARCWICGGATVLPDAVLDDDTVVPARGVARRSL